MYVCIFIFEGKEASVEFLRFSRSWVTLPWRNDEGLVSQVDLAPN